MIKPHITKTYRGWVASLDGHHSEDGSPVKAYWKLVEFMNRCGTWPSELSV